MSGWKRALGAVLNLLKFSFSTKDNLVGPVLSTGCETAEGQACSRCGSSSVHRESIEMWLGNQRVQLVQVQYGTKYGGGLVAGEVPPPRHCQGAL